MITFAPMNTSIEELQQAQRTMRVEGEALIRDGQSLVDAANKLDDIIGRINGVPQSRVGAPVQNRQASKGLTGWAAFLRKLLNGGPKTMDEIAESAKGQTQWLSLPPHKIRTRLRASLHTLKERGEVDLTSAGKWEINMLYELNR